MREIGTVPGEGEARRLADHLLARGIASKSSAGKAGWSVWVLDEDRVPEAAEELRSFVEDPDNPRYRESGRSATAIRRAAEEAEKAHRKATRDLRDRWEGPAWRKYPLTFALIAASVVAGLFTNLGQDSRSRAFHALLFTDFSPKLEWKEFRPEVTWASHGLEEIRRGEVWRLVTPMFLHFGVIHLVFNMVLLKQLGGMIEFRRGTPRYAAIVIVSAIASNLGQYLYQSRSTELIIFGGMSGVGYAVFGYLWMKGYAHPEERLGVNQNTVLTMVGWFFLCTTGFLGPVANAAHAVGLVAGMAFGLTRF